MIFPRTARYNKVMVHVNNLFIQEDIKTFPIDPFQIIENNKWGLVTYSELAWEKGVLVEDIIEAFQSEDGYTIYDGTNYTIAYNNTIKNRGRIRFTLMHEIGHIYMNHLVDFEETILMRNTLTEKKYKVLENEANSFARNILAPVMVVKDLKINSIDDVITYFEISRKAASVRLQTLLNDYRNSLSKFIQFQRHHFSSYIHSCLYSKQCIVCSYYCVNEEAIFCPICSSNRLSNKKGLIEMKYNGYDVDELGRALECPRCGNEELHYDGSHCKVCGTFLVNKCATTEKSTDSGYFYTEESCHATLDGNARYCVKCGNESTFFQQKLLESWEIEKEEAKERELLPF
ncbi:ImmA/IrrE family metallo-endopeptidase [Sutcliffiella sp. FSL R7-0096]|uniref:ImmA/IrrE family metallo-endopeptidase n=1 Tax=Sutcliffiella sp. FSL R7-0096 TaxID=2921670 RepID=UPI00315A22D0